MSVLQHLQELQSGNRRTQSPIIGRPSPAMGGSVAAQPAAAGTAQGWMAKVGTPPPPPGGTNVVIPNFSTNQVSPSSAQVSKTVQSSPAMAAYQTAMANGFRLSTAAPPPPSSEVSQNSANQNSAQVQNYDLSSQPQTKAIEPPEKVESYEEMFNRLHPVKPKTPEEIAAEEKRQKRNKLFGAISDGISSLANLYFTTQYAPSQDTGHMTETMQQRYDKINKDREQMEKEYWESLMRARKWDEDKGRGDRNEMRQERDWSEKMTDVIHQRARREIEERQKDRLHELEIKLKNGQLTTQEYNNEVLRVNAENAEEEKKLDMKLKRNHADYYARGGSRGTNSSSSGNGKSKYVVLQNKEGKKYYIPRDEWAGVAQRMFSTINEDMSNKNVFNTKDMGEVTKGEDFKKKTNTVPGQEAWVMGHWSEYPDLVDFLERYGYGNPDEEVQWPDDGGDDDNPFK